ncbi:hypothetical protein BGX38DRAFT_340704 [Terfezia claveryi]|nr:hypothetical protein BGX38DRAFT_340704 [Terfezia claveryi]
MYTISSYPEICYKNILDIRIYPPPPADDILISRVYCRETCTQDARTQDARTQDARIQDARTQGHSRTQDARTARIQGHSHTGCSHIGCLHTGTLETQDTCTQEHARTYDARTEDAHVLTWGRSHLHLYTGRLAKSGGKKDMESSHSHRKAHKECTRIYLQ